MACAERWSLVVLLLACNVDQRRVDTLMLGGCTSGSCTEPALPDGGSGGTLSGAAGASGMAGSGASGMAGNMDRITPPPPMAAVHSSRANCPSESAFAQPPVLAPSALNASANELAAFADPARFDPGGVCVHEPALSAAGPAPLYPFNWLRPRFRWQSSGGQTLWEIRLASTDYSCALRAYTRDNEWLPPLEIWNALLRTSSLIQVTIRGLGAAGALVGARGNFEIAPVLTSNGLIFSALEDSRTTSAAPTHLMTLQTGEDTAKELLRPALVQTGSIPAEDGATARSSAPSGYPAGSVACIGCHVLSPDAKSVVFADAWPNNLVNAAIEPETLGRLPSTITNFAAELLKQPWFGEPTFSTAHFRQGDRILLASYGLRPDPQTTPQDPTPPTRLGLAWFDLDASDTAQPIPALIPGVVPPGSAGAFRDARNAAMGAAFGSVWGTLALTGETRSAKSPTWSHDGTDIVYVSSDVADTNSSAMWSSNVADLRRVPYGNRVGGAIAPVPGAADPNFLEYLPAYSSDDAFLAFTRAPSPSVPIRCAPTLDTNGAVVACPAQDLGPNPDGPYYNRNGEVYVIARGGGEPIRLAANDPVACSGEVSRGSINSWPQWAPRVERSGGKRYYFLTFSSARNYPGTFDLPAASTTPPHSSKSSQLYLTALVVDEATGAVETRPAIYIWSQDQVLDPSTGATLIRHTSNSNASWLP